MTNEHYTIQEKLHILADAAKYDVACTSSGSSRRGQKGELGNAVSCGIVRRQGSVTAFLPTADVFLYLRS